MFIDFGKTGKADLMLNWLFVGDPTTPWWPTISGRFLFRQATSRFTWGTDPCFMGACVHRVPHGLLAGPATTDRQTEVPAGPPLSGTYAPAGS